MIIKHVLLGKIPTKPTLLKKEVPYDSRRILGYFYNSSTDLHLKVAFKDEGQQAVNQSERTFMIVPINEYCDMDGDAWVYIGSASGTFLFMKIIGPNDAKYWRFIPDA
jgi:hypothetical protein